MSFNPYRVFKFVATIQAIVADAIRSGFNPYRVFKFVATVALKKVLDIAEAFQSLSGFQVRCNSPGLQYQERRESVSIPIGFSSSLQHNPNHPHQQRPGEFQSLSGFQVRCNRYE